MARTNHRLGAVAAAAAAAVTLAACGGGLSEEQPDSTDDTGGGGAGSGQALVIGTINPPASFNPINQTDVGGQWANEFLFERLLVQPEALNFQPALADSFESEDSQNYTITLNPDATWSDGEPVTAEDVAFTLNLIAHPDSLTHLGSNISALEGVDAVTGKLPEGETEIPGVNVVDELTVELTTKAPVDQNYVFELLGTRISILPEHHLGDIPPAEFGDSDFATLPDLFSGPYTLENYTEGVSIEYAARDDYFRGGPEIDSVVVRIMPAANLAGDLQAGAIHMNTGGGIGNIPVNDVGTVEALENVTTRIDPTLGVQFVYFNVENVSDVEIRQAVAQAINREQIVDQLLQGRGEIVDGVYSSQHPYLDTDLPLIEYDPDAASDLLEGSSYDGSPIRLLVPTGNLVREQSANIIVQNLEAIGLNVEQSNVDFPTLLSMAQSGDYDMLLVGNSFNVDPDMTPMLGSEGASNYMNYASAENDDLLARGAAEPDPEVRFEIYSELQALWQHDLPYFSLYSDHAASVVSNEIAVGGPAPFWRGSLADLNQWAFGAQ